VCVRFFLGASIYFVDERSLYIVKNSIFLGKFDSLCCYVISCCFCSLRRFVVLLISGLNYFI
jgi:hypothetical protein